MAEALRVPVRDLFLAIDDAGLNSRVESLKDRTHHQQVARDRTSGAWRWLYIGIGVIATLLSFTFAQGLVLFLNYWIGGTMILLAVRRLYLEPHLDEKYPLSRGAARNRSRSKKPDATHQVSGDAPRS